MQNVPRRGQWRFFYERLRFVDLVCQVRRSCFWSIAASEEIVYYVDVWSRIIEGATQKKADLSTAAFDACRPVELWGVGLNYYFFLSERLFKTSFLLKTNLTGIYKITDSSKCNLAKVFKKKKKKL